MDNFNTTKYFRNQYLKTAFSLLNEAYLPSNEMEKEDDIDVLLSFLNKNVGIEFEDRIGSSSSNQRKGYYLRVGGRGKLYWEEDDINKVKKSFEDANKATKRFNFEFSNTADYETDIDDDRSWPASITFFAVDKPLEETDINDPVLMKMRAAKNAVRGDSPASQGKRAAIEDNISRVSAKKIAFLKKERAQLMRDMEQEAEPEGGPIADEYGSKLNRIDKAIAKLSGRKEMDYDTAVGKVMNESEDKWNSIDVSRKAEKELGNKEWNERTQNKLNMLISLNKAGKFKKNFDEERLQGWVDKNYSWEKLSQQFIGEDINRVTKLTQLVKEEKSGLWANIRAKRASSKPMAKKGSKAYTSAVKAGNKINKEKS